MLTNVKVGGTSVLKSFVF